MKKLKSLFVIALVSSLYPLQADFSPSLPPHPFETQGGKKAPEFSKANAVAIHWINLADAHVFGATWLESGGLLKDIVTHDQWAAAMEQTRLALGPTRARKVIGHSFATNLPFGMRGNFIIIRYRTQFAKSPNAIETVTLMTEGELAEWRVIGYRIEHDAY